MKCTTSWASAASNASSANGRSSADACRTSTPGYRSRGRGDERRRRVDGGDVLGPEPVDELGGQRPRPAADVEHPLARLDTGEVGELRESWLEYRPMKRS